MLLQALYTIRSERQLMEQLDYNLLFRWFVGLSMDAPVWDATVFSKNRDRPIVDAELTQASGTAEREAALAMVERYREHSKRRITLGADKAYDARQFVRDLRAQGDAPHRPQRSPDLEQDDVKSKRFAV